MRISHWRRLAPPAIVRHSLIYFATVGAGQLTSMLLLPIVTRFLPPAEYGAYSLVLVVTGFVGIFGSTWIRNVALRLYFDYVASARTRAFFWTTAALQALVMSACLVAGYAVAAAAGRHVPADLYAWAAISVLVSDFYALAVSMLRAGHKSTLFGAAEFSSALLRLGTTWIGLLLGFRTPAMLFAFATISMSIASLVAAVGIRSVLTGPIQLESAVARELVRVGVPSIPLSFGGWIMALSDRAILAYFVDLRAVGVYSAAYSLADRAVGGLAAALFLIVWPTMLTEWSRDPATAPRVIARSFEAYVLLSVGPAVLLIVYRTFILGLLTSPDYLSAVGVIPWVVAGAWILGMTGYLNRPLELAKQYGVVSAIAIGSAAVNVVLNLLLVPRWGIMAAAISTTCAYAAGALLSRVWANRVLHVAIPWRALGVAGGAAILSIALTSLLSSAYVAIAVFIVSYFASVGAWTLARRPVAWAGVPPAAVSPDAAVR